jgi:hypothetical protein
MQPYPTSIAEAAAAAAAGVQIGQAALCRRALLPLLTIRDDP